MNATIASTHPSELFGQAVEILTPKEAAKILGCGYTHIRKQAANPEKQEEARRSFIKKIHLFFEALMKKSPSFARTLCWGICKICKGKFVPDNGATADKETISDELLDNISALSQYTEIMRDPNATIEEKRAKLLILIDELEQDFDERLK